jgi:ABC-type proline/glycine betaine transport system permease subunit
MFGPLNGVRSALVIAAAVAALAAAVLGEWVMAGMLSLGVLLHGVGWWYLWRHRHTPDNR